MGWTFEGPYASDDYEACYVATGTMGSLPVCTMPLKNPARAEDRSWCKPFDVAVASLTRIDPLARQLEHFGAVVRGETLPLVTVRDGVANLRVTEAIATAARTGQIVEIPTS